jgi:hypothetical protein
MLILIVSLLCEHCDFDDLSEQREGMYGLPMVKWRPNGFSVDQM